MRVVEHRPQMWFLLKDTDQLYLDVNASYSAASFGMVIKLTEDESHHYRNRGENYLDELANAVQQHALTSYRCRNLHNEIGSRVSEAVKQWNRTAHP